MRKKQNKSNQTVLENEDHPEVIHDDDENIAEENSQGANFDESESTQDADSEILDASADDNGEEMTEPKKESYAFETKDSRPMLKELHDPLLSRGEKQKLRDKTQLKPAKPPTSVAAFGSTREYQKLQRRAQIMQNVRDYILDKNLEPRVQYYEHDDPAFFNHFRRAHKFYEQLEECQGKDDWNIEVMGHTDADDRYAIKWGVFRRTLPIPEELREKGISGKIKFVLRYYDPYMILKRERKNLLPSEEESSNAGGWQCISSRPIILPAAQGTVVSSAQQIAGQGSLPGQKPAQSMDEVFNSAAQFQKMMEISSAMMMKAINMNMEANLNRDKILDEGIKKGEEIGSLKQRLADVESKHEQLSNLYAEKDSELQELQTSSSGSGMHPLVSQIIEGFAEKFMPKGAKPDTSSLPSAE